ncbi:Phage Mu protein F like protein [Humidesulfovibrio mexicanus]|uniref:Phage Mu protein F like protein n=1 Tax=Humidesulfovibrio mexicanus TaxID=147047 RepID=A0A239BD41_9BACT|nr:phage minor head protein [Humidesulfovibrio mexicanus]SNS05756.1 Phage Mu protein F like protein [Humidesulfovibrio mexicanus]
MPRREFTPKPGFTFPGPPPKEALEFFRAKGLKPSFSYQDVWAEENVANFTVAKAMQLDVLSSISDAAERALSEGRTFRDFAKDLKPELQRQGWWGKREVVDPLTGKTRMAQLGSPRRLKTIYDTNMRTARAAGQWERIQRTKRALPFLLYELGPSREHRPEHAAWAGLMLPVDDPFWRSHYPPNGYGCKCRVRQVSRAEATRLEKSGVSAQVQETDSESGLPTGRFTSRTLPVRTAAPEVRTRQWTNRRTGEVSQVPVGIDPGFDYNFGEAYRVRQAARQWAEKVAAAPTELGAAAAADMPAEVLANLNAEYREWARRIARGDAVGAGGRRVVGAMRPRVVEKLAELGELPTGAALTIEQREVTHLLAEARKGEKALPEEVVLNLPAYLAKAKAVIWDGAGRRKALLYVLDLEQEKLGRVVVRLDHSAKGVPTNAVRSGSRVQEANLKQKGMVVLDGQL